MLRISKLTDYAIVIMTQFAKIGPCDARAISELTKISYPTTRKVLKLLVNQGLLSTTRGSQGGHTLSRPSDKITVTEIIQAIEGPIALTECSDNTSSCALAKHCHAVDHWQLINQKIHSTLNTITLSDMSRSMLNLQPYS